MGINHSKGNVCLVKKVLFLNEMSVYNNIVDDRKLFEKARKPKKRGGSNAGDPLFFYKKSNVLQSHKYSSLQTYSKINR